MTSIADRNGRLLLLMKGAPEIVLDRCVFQLDATGVARPISSADRELLIRQIHEAAGRAMRTLAFAHRELPSDTPTDERALRAGREDLEHGLVFDGFVAIRDPIRPEVPAAIRRCREAGIQVKMITGDNVADRVAQSEPKSVSSTDRMRSL